MVILPKLLYLFTNIPYHPGRSFFSMLRTELIRLTWGGKQARIQWNTLTCPYSKGGFDIPNFELYYDCAQAHYAHFWFHPPSYMPQVAAEHWLSDPIPLIGAIFTPKDPRSESPTPIACTARAWRSLCTRTKSPMLYSPTLPLVYHPHIPLLQEGVFRKTLTKYKIHTWGDLFLHGKFRTLQQMFPAPPRPLWIVSFIFAYVTDSKNTFPPTLMNPRRHQRLVLY